MLISSPPFQEHFSWKTALISIIPVPVTPVLGPDSLPSSVVWPRGLVPSGGPPSPNYRLQTYSKPASPLPYCCLSLFSRPCGSVCGVSPPPPTPSSILFTLLFSVLPPSFPPSLPSNLHAYIPPCPPGSGCSTSAAAVLAKNRCPRNTSPVREKEWERERKKERGRERERKHMEAD